MQQQDYIDFCNQLEGMKSVSQIDLYNQILDAYLLGFMIGKAEDKEEAYLETIQQITQINRGLKSKKITIEDKLQKYEELINNINNFEEDDTQYIVVPIQQSQSKVYPQCKICWSGMLESNQFTLQFCGHQFHKQCLQQQSEVSQELPLKCPQQECGKEISDLDAKSICKPMKYEQLQENALQKYLIKYFQCPTQGCGSIYEIEGPFLVCQKCNRLFCTKCRNEYHDGDCKIESFIAKANGKIKKCPLCKAIIEKQDGCNHMKCRCAYEFCFNCGKEWYGEQECNCPQPLQQLQENQANQLQQLEQQNLQRDSQWQQSQYQYQQQQVQQQPYQFQHHQSQQVPQQQPQQQPQQYPSQQYQQQPQYQIRQQQQPHLQSQAQQQQASQLQYPQQQGQQQPQQPQQHQQQQPPQQRQPQQSQQQQQSLQQQQLQQQQQQQQQPAQQQQQPQQKKLNFFQKVKREIKKAGPKIERVILKITDEELQQQHQ